MAKSSGQTNLENISNSNVTDKVENSELRETNVKGSDEAFEMYCETCNREGMHAPAYAFCTSCVAHFCSTCSKSHGKFLPDHKYLEGDKLPQEICTEKCDTHTSEILKFYCTTCSKFVCTVCKTNDHTNACTMNYLPDLVKEFKTSEAIDELMSSRNDIAKRLSDTSAVIGTKHKSICDIAVDTKCAINKEKEEMFKHIDQDLSKMEENAKSLKTKNDMRVGNLREDFESLDTNINQLLDNIKKLPSVPKSRRHKLYIELKQLSSELKQVNEAVESVKKECFSSNDALECELKVQAKDLTENVKKIRAIVKFIEKSEETVEDKPVKHACPLGEINVRADGDRENCLIIDCCVLSKQYLIVCDKNNKSLKLVDTKINKLLYIRPVKSIPESVTKLNDTDFAVVQSYPEYRSVIEFLTLTKAKTLVFRKCHIFTEMPCCAIAYINDGRLVISMSLGHEGKVQLLDMKGNVLANIEVNSEGNRLFSYPGFIAFDTGTKCVYVSDWYEDKIIEIDLGNQTTREIAYRFWHPEGITTDQEGFVYVVEAGTNRIHFFHPRADDVERRVLLDLFSSPYQLSGIFHCVADEKLYVGYDGYDCIHVYRIDDKEEMEKRQ